jgi:drug/metabolite transporter (DMT)-like permease
VTTTTALDAAGLPVDRRPRLGAAAVAAATLTWSFGGVLGRSVGAPGPIITLWRMWLAAALLSLVLAARGERLRTRALRVAGPAGALFALNLTAFFTAVQHTSIANAAVIGTLTPVVTLPIAVTFLSERLTALRALCCTAAVAGVVWAILAAPATGGDGGEAVGRSWLGDGLAVVSLLIWVGYIFATKSARRQVTTLEFMAGSTLVGAVVQSVVVMVMLAVGVSLPNVSGVGWLWLVLLTVGPGMVGHGLVTWAHRHVDAAVSTVLMQGEPVGAIVAAFVLLGEGFAAWQALAMALVIAAVGVLALRPEG